MKIGVAGSMQKTEQMIAVRDDLISLGHDAFVTSLAAPFIGKSDQEKEELKLYHKKKRDAIREFWRLMQGANALIVVNVKKDGIENYIGGNAFLEMGFAHVLEQKRFLMNPVPENRYYRTEIEAMNPTIINGDLTKVV